MSSRFILHPIFENNRSRYIFYIFSAMAILIGIAFWILVSQTLERAGLNRNTTVVLNNSIVTALLSNYFQAALILATSVVGTGLTARHTVGPIKRIEQWLTDWNNNLNPFPLLVRKNDKFSYLVDLLNQLYQQANRPSGDRPPSD